MPAVMTRYTGLKAGSSSSVPCWPMAKTSTASTVASPTVSTNMANRSATRVMPNGAGQPPSWVACGPSRSTRTSSATEATSAVETPTSDTTRCTIGSR